MSLQRNQVVGSRDKSVDAMHIRRGTQEYVVLEVMLREAKQQENAQVLQDRLLV